MNSRNLIKLAKLLFFLSLFSNSLIIRAQKCNFEKNEIDALTELAVKRTTPEMLLRINGQPLYVKAQCIGPNKYLKILFYKYNDFSFREDREVGFILSNNEEVVLYPRLSSVDTTKSDERLNATSLLIYKLSDNQYQTLTNNLTVEFKYFLATGFVVDPIKNSKQGKVRDVLKCVE